jgi:putative methyltransferase (TIGR04325 family)
MKIKPFVKMFIPPILVNIYRRILKNKNTYTGDFGVWSDAVRESDGYDSEVLIKKIVDANRAVLLNSNKFERDSIVFDAPQYAVYLNAYLLLIKNSDSKDRPLKVFDYGGALGTVYRQFKKFTEQAVDVDWRIFEQRLITEVGLAEFSSKELSFTDSETVDFESQDVDVVIVSSVLEFIENPYLALDKLERTKANFLIFDRTPLWDGMHDVLTVCTAAKYIGGSYPNWIFSEKKFKKYLFSQWKLIHEWNALGEDIKFHAGDAIYKGLFLKRKNNE